MELEVHTSQRSAKRRLLEAVRIPGDVVLCFDLETYATFNQVLEAHERALENGLPEPMPAVDQACAVKFRRCFRYMGPGRKERGM